MKITSMLGAASLVITAVPFISPAVANADDDCAYNFYLNTDTNQCQYCDDTIAYWNYDTNQCLVVDLDAVILGPAGPIDLGPDPVVGPIGAVGIGRR